MAVLKAFIKECVAFIVCFLLLRYTAFSVAQSLVLSGLFIAGCEAYATLDQKASRDEYFCPHSIVIQPNLEALLLDYKILENQEQIAELHRLWQGAKSEERIAFTVLGLRPSGDWIIYDDQDRCFVSEMNFEQEIPAVAYRTVSHTMEGAGGEQDRVRLRGPNTSEAGSASGLPALYFRQRFGQYEFGLTVREEWWRQIRKQNPEADFGNAQTDTDYGSGQVWVPIATLPLAVFDQFRVRYDDHKNSRKLSNQLAKVLPTLGWSRPEETLAETDDRSSHWNHRYFSVSFRAI